MQRSGNKNAHPRRSPTNSFVVPRIPDEETRRRLQCDVTQVSGARDKACRFRGTDGVLQRSLYSNRRDGRTTEAVAHHPAPASVGGSAPRSSRLVSPNLVPPLRRRHAAKVVDFLSLVKKPTLKIYPSSLLCLGPNLLVCGSLTLGARKLAIARGLLGSIGLGGL